jgi:hypothetical protein
LYATYLVRATLLLGAEPFSLLLGAVLLALEFAALVLLVTNAFEMTDALCGPPVDSVRPSDPERWPTVCLQVPC